MTLARHNSEELNQKFHAVEQGAEHKLSTNSETARNESTAERESQ